MVIMLFHTKLTSIFQQKKIGHESLHSQCVYTRLDFQSKQLSERYIEATARIHKYMKAGWNGRESRLEAILECLPSSRAN